MLPYPFTHVVHAKKRWFGRPLLEVLSAEFRHQDEGVLPQGVD